VLDTQDYLVLKVTLVLLEQKGFQGLEAPLVLVFQALRGNLDLKVMRDFLDPQEFLDDRALQVRDLVQFRDSHNKPVSWAQKVC